MDFWTSQRFANSDLDEMIAAAEAKIAEQRAIQIEAIDELLIRRAHLADGYPSLAQRLAGQLDLATETARALVSAAKAWRGHPLTRAALESGTITFDRASALMAMPIGEELDVEASRRFSVEVLRRRIARHRRITLDDERHSFVERFFMIQPSLDESSWSLRGELTSLEGRVVEKALHDRADEFRALPGGDESTRGQRQADALVAMAQDSLERHVESDTTDGGATVAVIVDLNVANGSGGEAGAEVEYGPRVGPAALAELLCSGSVQVIGMEGGRPVVTSDASKAIPPAVRHALALRDAGCTIEGCTSRYRLQPHHIRERQRGGTHDPDNLTTLCWYHHHVAVHRLGFRIDAASPPTRRRLLRPRAGPGPP
jgi:HNH endonuclease/Domain of unknown function (DUF222)